MVTMEFSLHASRLNVFRSFILKMAVELESRLAGHEGTDLVMKRRRTQCHWLLDRTSLCAAVFILASAQGPARVEVVSACEFDLRFYEIGKIWNWQAECHF